MIKERTGLDKAKVEWPDENELIEHEVQVLKPAPNPREQLQFGEEQVTHIHTHEHTIILTYKSNNTHTHTHTHTQVQCTEYTNLGENVTIYRPRKNIPKGAKVRLPMRVPL